MEKIFEAYANSIGFMKGDVYEEEIACIKAFLTWVSSSSVFVTEHDFVLITKSPIHGLDEEETYKDVSLYTVSGTKLPELHEIHPRLDHREKRPVLLEKKAKVKSFFAHNDQLRDILGKMETLQLARTEIRAVDESLAGSYSTLKELLIKNFKDKCFVEDGFVYQIQSDGFVKIGELSK